MNLIDRKARLRAATSALALISIMAPGAVRFASAQEAVSDGNVETVVVSSSRLKSNGFDSPTPTTVVGGRDLENQADPQIFTSISELPSLAGSTGTTAGNGGVSAATNGLSSFNLRGLGTNRTLTLLDGERVVSSLLTGVVDVSQLPQGLVERVDVVTGGASASWGSDAVSGVVNFILNKKFSGFKADVEGGISTYGDDSTASITMTGGTDFAGGRGHIEADAEFLHNDGVPRGIGSRSWYQGTKLTSQSIASTPAGTPQFLVENNATVYTALKGGIITAGPLKGTAFGQGGAPFQYTYGSPILGSYQVGGDYQDAEIGYTHSGIDAALNRGALYGRVSYDLTPTTTIYATGLYGAMHTFDLSIAEQYKNASLTIQCNNAFLPTAVTNACAANGITSFQYGTNNYDFQSRPGGGLSTIVNRTLRRFTVGVDGAANVFGTDWTWNAHAEHGYNTSSDRLPNTSITPYYNAAIQAVRNSNGAIVCASAVAVADGCQPLNIFGYGVASQQALNWVLGTPTLLTQSREEAAAFSFNGNPFSDWAGEISVAAGLEWREEGFTQQADCISQGVCATAANPAGDPLLSATSPNYFAGNFHPSRGSYHITEAFLETDIPLLKDNSWGMADLNLAIREAGYSTAGTNTTWKVGFNYTPAFVNGFRIRALQSRDVRAPNLGELYQAPVFAVSTVVDDFPPRAGQTTTISAVTAGNPNLKVESSQTSELGIVYQPDWFPGFSTSIDYYRIGLKNAISSVSTQQTMDLCFQGNTALCSNITRNPDGTVARVTTYAFNLASTVTDGFDFETSYQANLADWSSDLDGNLVLRALATHVSKYILQSGLPGDIPHEFAGNNGSNQAIANQLVSIPLWHGLGVETYSNDKYSITLTERYISPGVLSKDYIECTTGCPTSTTLHPTINNNRVAGAFYLDVSGSYYITPALELYGKVANIANVDPPITANQLQYQNSTNPNLYDVIGRSYRLGLRLKL